MNKIFLVIQREYLERVRKKSFFIMSILGPLLIAGFYGLIIYFATTDQSGPKQITVIDQSGRFEGRLSEKGSITFNYSKEPIEDEIAKIYGDDPFGVLFIPSFELENPAGFIFHSEGNPGIIVSDIERAFRDEIRAIKMEKSGVEKELLDSFETIVSITSINADNKESSAGLAIGIGAFTGVMIYFFIILYGTQVMRGVVTEKSSKVVEIIISSIKPFQLMVGKIMGIAAVGLTQLLIWFILTATLTIGASSYFAGTLDSNDFAKIEEMQSQKIGVGPEISKEAELFEDVMSKIKALPLTQMIFSFFFYFIGGYLMYAALFALVGSSVDAESDAQQFMLPIMMPLILAMSVISPIIQNPDGPLAFWMSMIPFTSPVIMMIRQPFGVPGWELALSMTFLIVGFLFCTWLAGRIYRIGILMHGTKVNYKTLAKWLFTKA